MQFPINLNIEDQSVLVVGGGRIALRKTEGLVACGANVTVIAPEIIQELRTLPVRLIEREYQTGDIKGHRLVITATGITQVDQQIFDDAQTANVWVNSADDPQRCTFTLPAVLRRGDLMITTSTAGASPALASWVRTQIAQLIGPEYEQLVLELACIRAGYHLNGVSTETVDWKPIIEQALEDVRSVIAK